MTNKDLSSNLFDGVVLPDGANDCGTVYFKIAACSTATIAANGSFPGATGGGSGNQRYNYFGNISILRNSDSCRADGKYSGGSEIYGNTSVSLSCSTSDTAQIKYKINGGEATDYTGKFIPFKNISDKTVTIQTWAEQSGYTASETAIYTYTSTKDEITSFLTSPTANTPNM